MKIKSITLIDTDQLPKLGATPASRTWRGSCSLRVRYFGAWDGCHIQQPVGAHEGRHDRRFVRWCDEHGLLCVRTVDLFWLFEKYPHGFYGTVSVPKLRKKWKYDMRLIRNLRCSRVEKEEFRKRWGLGPWKSYLRQRRAYFVEQLARYDRAARFWRKCGQQARDSFLRCARYSNRQADAHPDYLVALRNKSGRVLDFGFFEVKGPRESLKPSQKRFFPELVRCAGQNVRLARFPMRGDYINLRQVTATGEVVPVVRSNPNP